MSRLGLLDEFLPGRMILGDLPDRGVDHAGLDGFAGVDELSALQSLCGECLVLGPVLDREASLGELSGLTGDRAQASSVEHHHQRLVCVASDSRSHVDPMCGGGGSCELNEFTDHPLNQKKCFLSIQTPKNRPFQDCLLELYGVLFIDKPSSNPFNYARLKTFTASEGFFDIFLISRQ